MRLFYVGLCRGFWGRGFKCDSKQYNDVGILGYSYYAHFGKWRGQMN